MTQLQYLIYTALHKHQSTFWLQKRTTTDSSMCLLIGCLFNQSNSYFGPWNNLTFKRFGMTSSPMSVRHKLEQLDILKTHLMVPDVNSTEGCIGNPWSLITAEMLYMDRTDATAIQTLSYASHRPGHILPRASSLKS